MVASGDIFILITHIVLIVIHFSYREPLHTNMYIVSMFEYKVLETTINKLVCFPDIVKSSENTENKLLGSILHDMQTPHFV